MHIRVIASCFHYHGWGTDARREGCDSVTRTSTIITLADGRTQSITKMPNLLLEVNSKMVDFEVSKFAFRQSLHGSFEIFQRDIRLEEAFRVAKCEVQAKLQVENLFSLEGNEDLEGIVNEAQEKGLSEEAIAKIKNSTVLASQLLVQCLHRMSFQVHLQKYRFRKMFPTYISAQVFPKDDFVRLACAVEETAMSPKSQRREVLGEILLIVDEEHSRGRKLFAELLLLLQDLVESRRNRHRTAEALGQHFATAMLPPHLLQIAQARSMRHDALPYGSAAACADGGGRRAGRTGRSR